MADVTLRATTLPPTFRFSTATLAPRDKLPVWRQWMLEPPNNCDLAALGDGTFECHVGTTTLSGATVVKLESAPFAVSRNPAQAANGDDNFNLSIVRQGRRFARQGVLEVVNNAGEAMLWSNDQTVSMEFPDGGLHQHVSIPRSLLLPLVPDLDANLMTKLPQDSAGLRLLSFYVTTLLDEKSDISPELLGASGSHIQDLVAITLGANRETRETAKGRGVRVARLRAIKADIEANLGASDLSLLVLSRRHGISPRYVRALFDGEGTSFTDYVLNRRLRRAHAALSDPRKAAMKISSIAFEAGFGDLSYFNLRFRRQFGLTPSEVRALAL